MTAVVDGLDPQQFRCGLAADVDGVVIRAAATHADHEAHEVAVVGLDHSVAVDILDDRSDVTVNTVLLVLRARIEIEARHIRQQLFRHEGPEFYAGLAVDSVDIAVVRRGVNDGLRVGLGAAVNDRSGLRMQRVTHRVANRRRRVTVFVANVHAAHPRDHLRNGRFAGGAGQSEVRGGIGANVSSGKEVARIGQRVICAVVRVQISGRRVGQQSGRAAEFNVLAVVTADSPDTACRIVEEARCRIDGVESVGIDDLAILDTVLLEVARPTRLVPGAEHRQVHVVEVSRSVERVDRHSRCRERQRAVVDFSDNPQKGHGQLLDVVRAEIVTAGIQRCVVQDRQVLREANRMRRYRLGSWRVRIDVDLAQVFAGVVKTGALTGVGAGRAAHHRIEILQRRDLGQAVIVLGRLTVRDQYVVVLGTGTKCRLIVAVGRTGRGERARIRDR